MASKRHARRPAYLVRGDVLTSARLERFLSQEEVAQRVRITRGSLSRAESGGPIRLETARALAEFYGLTAADVLRPTEAA